MMEEKSETSATHMDDFLKPLVVDKFRDAINFYIMNEDVKCVKSYIALYHMIDPYDFEQKDYLKELTCLLTDFIKEMGGKPIDTKQVLDFREKKHKFKELLQVYMSEIPKAYADLGVWFKTIKQYNDIDHTISEENFTSNVTQISERRKAILKLSTKEIVDLLKTSYIHHVYVKWRFLNAV